MNLFELSAKISVDDSNFKKSMQNAQKVSKDVASAVKQLQSPLDRAKTAFNAIAHPVETTKANLKKFKDATESLRHPIETFKKKVDDASSALATKRNRLSVLASSYDSAKKKVDQLTKEFNEAAKSTGVFSEKTQDLAKRLDDAENEMGDAKRKLEDFASGSSNSASILSKFGGVTKVVSGIISTVFRVALEAAEIALKTAAAAVITFTSALAALNYKAIDLYATFEQLAGGAAKIFNEMDQDQILVDARNAFIQLGISANRYLAILNDVGATFAATMGDKRGYDTARRGLIAISDYASGTGKNVEELSSKFVMITRSAASYQSIADQFSGILPATSAAFLEQAQATGILSREYKSLTEVPIAEYQAAVASMLEKGVANLGLAGNTAAEAKSTISGSIASTKAAIEDLFVAFADPDANFAQAIENVFTSAGNTIRLFLPRVVQVLENVSPAIESAIDYIFNNVPGVVSEYFPTILDLVTKIIATFRDSIVKNSDKIKESFVELIKVATSNTDVDSLAPTIGSTIGALLVVLSEILIESAPILLDAFEKLVDNVLAVVKDPETSQKATGSLVDLLTVLADSLLKFAGIGVKAFTTVVGSMLKSLISKETFDKLSEYVSSLVNKIASSLGNNGKKLYNKIKEIAGKMASSLLNRDWMKDGEKVIDKIKSGIESAWKRLKEWFNGIWDSFFGSKSVDFKFNLFSGEPDGSHANGLSYVPYDGYIAELHKGERVLTAREARGYSSGNSFGDIYINVNGANYNDEQSLASAIALEIQNMTDRRAAVYA